MRPTAWLRRYLWESQGSPVPSTTIPSWGLNPILHNGVHKATLLSRAVLPESPVQKGKGSQTSGKGQKVTLHIRLTCMQPWQKTKIWLHCTLTQQTTNRCCLSQSLPFSSTKSGSHAIPHLYTRTLLDLPESNLQGQTTTLKAVPSETRVIRTKGLLWGRKISIHKPLAGLSGSKPIPRCVNDY